MPFKIRSGFGMGMGIALALLLVLFIGGLWYLDTTGRLDGRAEQEGSPAQGEAPPGPLVVHAKITQPTVIDLNEIDRDENLREMVAERKQQYGLDDGIDAIARPDETLKIGTTTIPMKEILDKISLQRGDLIEADIDQQVKGGDRPYGIYIVQPGDNIWNIHFRFLRDYLDNRKVAVSPIADEPNRQGFSSGIGKILKFSENMVYIYNIRERKLSVNLNLIQPQSKLVVYNMQEVFSLLDQIDYGQVEHIEFDGETIWIPASG